jgi:hypothetical protein
VRGSRLIERRGRDLNPRRTQKPETVFETAASNQCKTLRYADQGARKARARRRSRRMVSDFGRNAAS